MRVISKRKQNFRCKTNTFSFDYLYTVGIREIVLYTETSGIKNYKDYSYFKRK